MGGGVMAKDLVAVEKRSLTAAQFRVPDRTVEILHAKAGMRRQSFWQKTPLSAVFADDFREPGTSADGTRKHHALRSFVRVHRTRKNSENQPRVPLASFP